ncbi:MAG: DNA repair protein RadB, partial [Methanobrevibacter sp.]|nr:DNA repair protein RadB [Methanobrevibacter sp.]
SKSSKIYKELGRQMKLLSSVSRKYDVAVLITNQIYSTFDSENNGDIRPIGGDVLKYWSKVIIELEKSDVIGQRIATLKRHRSMPEGISCNFRITSHGIY